MTPRDHEFVRSSDPHFGSVFGGGCDHQRGGLVCGWPESAHRKRPDDVEAFADEILAVHNGLYHPGRDCPAEDEDGACAARTGKPAVLLWPEDGGAPLRSSAQE